MSGGEPSVRALGRVRLSIGGSDRVLVGHSSLALALLIDAHPGSVSSDRLRLALWGDEPPATVESSLRMVMTRLRRAIGERPGPAAIESVGSGYRLAVDPIEIDVVRFETAAAELMAAPPTASVDADAWLNRCAHTAALWTGTPFDDLDDQPTLVASRARLVETKHLLDETLVEVLLEHEDFERAAQVAASLTDEAPLRERRWAQLMRALRGSGRQAEALRTYSRARTVLVEQAGVEPGVELRSLEQTVLADSGALGERDVNRPLRTESPSVPHPVGPIIGRERDLHHLRRLFERHRLVVLTGPGGVGKSRLAMEYCRGARVDQGVHFVPLVDVDEDGLVAAVATHFGAVSEGGFEELIERVAGVRGLLVLDNAEELIDRVAELSNRLLAASPELLVLVTSRVAFVGTSGARFELEPLDAGSAAEFLRYRATSERPNRVSVERDDEWIELAHGLDRLPLAIELAAPALGHMSAAALLRSLTDSPQLLSGRHHAIPHHRSISASVDRSLRLLSADDRAGFAALATFRGGFVAEDFVAVAGAVTATPADGLAHLVSNSLLAAEPRGEETRYTALATVRSVARAVAEPDALPRLEARHRLHFASVASAVDVGLAGPDERLWSARLELAERDLAAAFESAERAGDADAAAAIALGLHELGHRSFRRTIHDALPRALALPGVVGSSAEPKLIAAMAVDAWLRARGDDADGLAARAVAAATTVGAPIPLIALNVQLSLAGERADAEGGFATFLELNRHARDQSDLDAIVNARVCLSMGIVAFGLADEGLATAERALELAGEGASPSMLAWAHHGVGRALISTEPTTAAEILAEAARDAERSGQRWVAAMAESASIDATISAGSDAAVGPRIAALLRTWRRADVAAMLWSELARAAVVLDRRRDRLAPTIARAVSDQGYAVPLGADERTRIAQLADGAQAAPSAVELFPLVEAALERGA